MTFRTSSRFAVADLNSCSGGQQDWLLVCNSVGLLTSISGHRSAGLLKNCHSPLIVQSSVRLKIQHKKYMSSRLFEGDFLKRLKPFQIKRFCFIIWKQMWCFSGSKFRPRQKISLRCTRSLSLLTPTEKEYRLRLGPSSLAESKNTCVYPSLIGCGGWLQRYTRVENNTQSARRHTVGHSHTASLTLNSSYLCSVFPC